MWQERQRACKLSKAIGSPPSWSGSIWSHSRRPASPHLSDEQRSELDTIEKGTPDLERQIRAATVSVEEEEKEAEQQAAEQRERIELRSKASLTNYLAHLDSHTLEQVLPLARLFHCLHKSGRQSVAHILLPLFCLPTFKPTLKARLKATL